MPSRLHAVATPRGNVDARRAAGLLALAAALAWSLKPGLIVSNGGDNLDEGLVAVAYMLGLACSSRLAPPSAWR